MIVNLDRRPREDAPEPSAAVSGQPSLSPPQAVFQLPARPDLVRTARSIAGQVLTAWGLDADDRDALVLLVGELTANSALHGGEEMLVALDLDPGRSVVHLCVADLGEGRPGAGVRSLPDEYGRGLQIVAALADAWETHAIPSGLQVLVDYRLA
ncbi:ATP-binding protein [Streptacidiphilus sp. EB129]|uniref:ATP-binding protein n=1 Tax=Streptacidiphilus sp. EB129 TaxID=3156262 RepID=UPI00351611AF